MVTVKVNVVALIITGLIGAMFVTILKSAFEYDDMATIAILTYIVIRIYDAINGLPAFGGKKKESKPDNIKGDKGNEKKGK